MPERDRSLLDARIKIPDHVLFQEIQGRSAILHLQTETYFGLDDVGTSMWKILQQGVTVGAAAQALVATYDAPLERLQDDLIDLVQQLKDQGLLEIEMAGAGSAPKA